MLIARAPVRISLAGGGTDFPAYFEEHGGLVISTSINRYFYVIVNLNGQESVQITSSDYRTFYRHPAGKPIPWDGDLSLPKAVLHDFGIDRGISVFIASEIPPGTGLASSSAATVALVKALSTACGQHLTKAEVARLACRLEIDKLGAPIGWQDQFAAAFGGLNAIAFSRDGVRVEPLELAAETRTRLEKRLLLFFTHVSRNSATILTEQKAHSEQKVKPVVESLHALKAMALEVRQALESDDLDRVGVILHESWQQKKRLAQGISNARIDGAYETALANGAIGGKITGAGGGGFLLVYCREEHQSRVVESLESLGLRRMDFRFEASGAKVLTNALPRWQVRVRPSLEMVAER
ncbi:MAG: GHMP kinase [Chloroflexota bacterium]|nr:MAG: GHMP kinase [Chloroflexota bacterium]